MWYSMISVAHGRIVSISGFIHIEMYRLVRTQKKKKYKYTYIYIYFLIYNVFKAGEFERVECRTSVGVCAAH